MPALVLMPSAWCYLGWSERIIRSSGDFNSCFDFYYALLFALVMKFITYNLSPYKTWAKMVDHQTAISSICSGNQQPQRLRRLLTCTWVFGWHKLIRGPVVMQIALMSQMLGILGYPRSPRFQYWGAANDFVLSDPLTGPLSDERSVMMPQLLTDLLIAFR